MDARHIPEHAAHYAEAPLTRWYEPENENERGWKARDYWWFRLTEHGPHGPTSRCRPGDIPGYTEDPNFGLKIGYGTQKQVAKLLRNPQTCRGLLGATIAEISGKEPPQETIRTISAKIVHGCVLRSTPGWESYEQECIEREATAAQRARKKVYLKQQVKLMLNQLLILSILLMLFYIWPIYL